jgi:hypothetical protein
MNNYDIFDLQKRCMEFDLRMRRAKATGLRERRGFEEILRGSGARQSERAPDLSRLASGASWKQFRGPLGH